MITGSIKLKIGFTVSKLLTKKWFRIVLIVFVAVLIAVGVSRSKNKKATDQTMVQRGHISDELVLTGTVEAEEHVILYFPTAGKIAGVYVKEGDWVKKGQALTSLDKTVLNSTYQQALNNYRNYQAAAENVLDQVKDHSADETYAQKATRTAAEVARDNAYDAVKAAEYNLRNATILAPFDGFVTFLPFPNPGVNVIMTDAQVELLDPESIYFSVDADQNEVVSIKEGMQVIVVLDSERDRNLSGIVTFVSYSPKSGEASTLYEVKISFNEGTLSDFSPRLGMSGDAKFILSEKDDALFVPSQFINSDKDGKYVNLDKLGNKVRVETGLESETDTEIVSGVSEGDTLYD